MNLSLIILVFYMQTVSLLAKPNFVIILADDQDFVLRGLNPMKKTHDLLANKGATFVNTYTSSPICCPSRSSILSGQYAHNHKTFNNSKNGGCYSDHWKERIEPMTFPAQLQSNGYNTFYAGKYLNEYFSKDVPKGWSKFFGLHGNSKYFNYTLNENGELKTYQDEYLTDVLKGFAVDFLSKQEDKQPFFAMVSPPAPHQPFTPADRHKNLFPDTRALHTASFNVPSGPLDKHWLLTMEPKTLPEEIVQNLDVIYRKRWQSLMAIDDMVEDIVKILENQGLMQNTYIIYTSDNGFHIGQFAQAYDKRQPYETDIRVPFIVRGPGIEEKSIAIDPILSIDIAPTVLELAGIDVDMTKLDGKSFKNIFEDPEPSKFTERQMLIEYWGEGTIGDYNPDCPWKKQDRLYLCSKDNACHCQDSWNNTYACIRHLAVDLNFVYCEFKDNENFIEAYNLDEDEYQMNNIANTILPSIRATYSLGLVNLTECAGPTCRKLYY